MSREIELASLDLSYEGFRLKAPALEERLLGSIAQRGIEEPLEGVEAKESNMLLNGFKRFRCARKLRLATVPFSSSGKRRGRSPSAPPGSAANRKNERLERRELLYAVVREAMLKAGVL